MPEYFDTPFPFHDLIKKKSAARKLDLEESIRANIRSLILMRIGEFAYDRSLGFEMWDHDKQVFYHDKSPYYESKEEKKGLMENAHARKHFKENIRSLVLQNEYRLAVTNVVFGFEQVQGNMSVYQRKIKIEVEGRIKSTGKVLSPPFRMSIMYAPFQVEAN